MGVGETEAEGVSLLLVEGVCLGALVGRLAWPSPKDPCCSPPPCPCSLPAPCGASLPSLQLCTPQSSLGSLPYSPCSSGAQVLGPLKRPWRSLLAGTQLLKNLLCVNQVLLGPPLNFSPAA